MSKLFLILTLLIIATVPVRAETSRELRETRREEIQEIRTERLEEREQIRTKVAENHASRLERRFSLYYKRLENIVERFQKRLDYLKTQNKDVASIQTKLDSIKTKLNGAKVAGDEAVAAFQAIDPGTWEVQKPKLLAAKDLANEARELYKEVHTLLKAALRELKQISKPALPASSAAVMQAQ